MNKIHNLISIIVLMPIIIVISMLSSIPFIFCAIHDNCFHTRDKLMPRLYKFYEKHKIT